jgi:hypothetical protein
MHCANCTIMGFATNLILTPSYSIAYEVMNKFVTHNFIIDLKIRGFISWAPILATKPPWQINLPWAMQSLT